jgi:hypothetical protein
MSLMKKKTTYPNTSLFSPEWILPMIPLTVPAWHLSSKVSTRQVPSCFHDNICFTFCVSTPTLFSALQLPIVLQKWIAKPAYLFNNFSSIPVSVYLQNNTSTHCTHSSLQTLFKTGKPDVNSSTPACLQAPSLRLFTRQKDIYPKVSGVLIAPLSTPYLYQNMLSPAPIVFQLPEGNPTLNATFHVPTPP